MPGPAAAAVPELDFEIERADPWLFATAPTLRLGLRVESGGAAIRSLLLDVQVRIAARRRSYSEGERERLADLFGRPEQWASSVQSLLWTNATVLVPGFEGETVVDVPLACTYDFEVTAARYLHSLEGGAVPLELLFSGTVLHAGEGGARLTRLPLDREATFDLPVSTWREAVEHFFPDSAWLRLRRRSFERLHAYRARNALPTWEATIDALLEEGGG